MESQHQEIKLDTIINSLYSENNNYDDFYYKFEENNYLLHPVPFIKMCSRYIEGFVQNYVYGKIVKNIRNHFKIKVKFNLSKYQITRLFLEAIFNREKTKEIDELFSQLKLYGNFLIDMNITYDEIINTIYECQINTNHYVKKEISSAKEKLDKMKTSGNGDSQSIFDDIYDLKDFNEFKGLNNVEHLSKIKKYELKIVELKNNIKVLDMPYINNYVYSMIKHCMDKLHISVKENIMNKVSRYLENMSSYESFKNLDNYENNNGVSLGKMYENDVFEKLKPILNQYGYEIIQNVEFMFKFELSGCKLEYDFIIGKIVEDTFMIYGVFDAKISKVLIKKDIDKFIQSINNLKQNKLQLRYIRDKEYLSLFNKVAVNEGQEVMFGYFCQPNVDHTKETSKVVSSYLIENSKKTFDLIKDCHITFSDSQKKEIEEIIKTDNNSLVGILDSNNTRVFNHSYL